MRPVFLSLFVLFSCVAPASAEDAVDVPTRDTRVRLLVEVPAGATHMVMLVPGGQGNLTITDDGRIEGVDTNFVVRTRAVMTRHGFATAVVDSPADMPELTGRRGEPAYAEDMATVVRFLRANYGLPVWAHGTSRGTVGLAATFSKAPSAAARPDGLILSASVTRQSDKGFPTVFDGDIGAIDVPVLVLHHRDDPCNVTPPDGARRLFETLKMSTRKDLVYIGGGGESARGRKCGALTAHGFIDVEEETIKAVIAFIRGGT